jgi:hypothetical protein
MRLARVPWLLLALLLIGAAWSIRPAADTDILWHLRAGQWMLAQGDVIRADPFSVTRWGCEWVSVPWLHEILLVRLRQWFGWPGLTLLQVLATAGLALEVSVLAWLLRRRGGRWDWRWPWLSVPAALSVLLFLRLYQMRINGRPEMHTYLLAGADLIVLTFLAQTPSAAARRWLPWLPPLLQVWWTNTHGAFILGPLLVGAFAAGAWVHLLCRPGEAARPLLPALRLTLSALLTVLACFATPYGTAGALYPLHLFGVLTDPLYSRAIAEGRPVDLATCLESGSLGDALLACWVLAFLGLVGRLAAGIQYSVFRSRKAPILNTEHWILNTPLDLNLGYALSLSALAYLSLAAVRNVPLLPLVAAPLVANGIEYAADGLAAVAGRLGARRRRRDPAAGAASGVAWLHGSAARIAGRVLLAAGLLLVYRSIVSERFYDSLGWRTRFAAGFSDHEHPLAAGRFLSEHAAELPARLAVYGDTRSANYLLARFGPAWQTYFDGRHAEIYDPPVFRTAVRTRRDPELFAREAQTYGIGLACFALADVRDRNCPLMADLYRRTNEWALVYLDDCAAVFAGRAISNAAFAACWRLPCPPPPDAAGQRAAFAAWMAVQGRESPAAFDDPANEALSRNTGVRTLQRALQLGGLWASRRDWSPRRLCRLAAFLDSLGWQVVADDFYEHAARLPGYRHASLSAGLQHAIDADRRAGADPAWESERQARIADRGARLRQLAPHDPVGRFAAAHEAQACGRFAAAAAILEDLLRRHNDAAFYDLLAACRLALGDAASDRAAAEREWRAGVKTCRERLAVHPSDRDAPQAHRLLGDLLTRLGEPLAAAASHRLATNAANTVR